jgi:hypothetical protein
VTIILTLDGAGGDPRPTVESVAAQVGPRPELIVVDASVEGRAGAIADAEGVRVLEAPGEGHGELMRRGLADAEGELVGFLRATDALEPQAVGGLLEALREDPEAVAAHAWFRRLDEDGRTLATVSPIAFDVSYAVRLHDFPIGPAAIVRRDALGAIGGPDAGLRWAADDDLWIRLGSAGRFAPVHEPLGARRPSSRPQTLADRERMARERVALIDKVYEAEPLAREFELVVDQAYRNAFVYAATLVGPGFSGPEERFYVADRLAIDPQAPEELPWADARLMERKARAAQLENQLAWRTAAVNLLRAGIAEREHKIEELRNPPPPPHFSALRHAVKRVVPPSLRPVVVRLAGRGRPEGPRDDG